MNRGQYKFRTTEIAAFVAFSFGELFSTIWLISYLVGSKPTTFPLLEQGAFANEIAYWGVQIVAILCAFALRRKTPWILYVAFGLLALSVVIGLLTPKLAK